MRILVTGSRYGWDPVRLEEGLREVWRQAMQAEIDRGEILHNPTLVHGAARGVDTQAKEFWESHGLPTEAHPAKGREFGAAAGPIRNTIMVESGIDYGIAFLDEDSRGTKDCLAKAEAAGIPMMIVRRRD